MGYVALDKETNLGYPIIDRKSKKPMHQPCNGQSFLPGTRSTWNVRIVSIFVLFVQSLSCPCTDDACPALHASSHTIHITPIFSSKTSLWWMRSCTKIPNSTLRQHPLEELAGRLLCTLKLVQMSFLGSHMMSRKSERLLPSMSNLCANHALSPLRVLQSMRIQVQRTSFAVKSRSLRRHSTPLQVRSSSRRLIMQTVRPIRSTCQLATFTTHPQPALRYTVYTNQRATMCLDNTQISMRPAAPCFLQESTCLSDTRHQNLYTCSLDREAT
jgi:hypothetical protein